MATATIFIFLNNHHGEMPASLSTAKKKKKRINKLTIHHFCSIDFIFQCSSSSSTFSLPSHTYTLGQIFEYFSSVTDHIPILFIRLCEVRGQFLPSRNMDCISYRFVYYSAFLWISIFLSCYDVRL